MSRAMILTLNNKEEWLKYYYKLPARAQDIFYTPQYYELYENYGDGRALCFVLTGNDEVALYPFLMNCINDLGYDLDKTYYDIQGAYGYNGVVSSKANPDFVNEFYKSFEEYCADNSIIAEFTRFNPLIHNHKFSEKHLNTKFNRSTVFFDLSGGYDTIYKEFSHQIKGNIKKAQNNKLNIRIFEGEYPYKQDFIDIYTETMNRANSVEYTYFNERYFTDIFNNMQVTNFIVFKDDIPVSGALCLSSPHYLHIHLEASRQEFLHLRVNDFLINEIVRFAALKGYRKVQFGGGRTTSEDDSLLRFKRKFSKNTSGFYTGAKIRNEKIYNDICEQWNLQYPGVKEMYDSRILKYRFGLVSDVSQPTV